MEGYQCDQCDRWFEGIAPNKKGWHEWLFAQYELYSMEVKAYIIPKEGSTRNHDICPKCFLQDLETFIKACRAEERKPI